MWICREINYPLSRKKTIWATHFIVFLGLLFDMIHRVLSVPLKKRYKALFQISEIFGAKKIRMHKLQRLTALLNFFGRAIVPGRAFTRHLYYKTTGLKQHHHMRVDPDTREDLKLWKAFLVSNQSVCRPFMDFSKILEAEEIQLTSDVSKLNGWGCCAFGPYWSFAAWTQKDKDRVELGQSNIQIQEMLAFTAAVELFAPLLRNKRVITYCDNEAVMQMINNSSSKCKVCMEMIRVVTFTSMRYNCRFFSRWIPTKKNGISDALSCLDFKRFRKLAPGMDKLPLKPPLSVWPMKDDWWLH